MMKRSIAIGIILILAGGLYIWWWNLPLRETRELAVGGPSPKSWAELDENFPHFARACRAIKEDPLARSEAPSGDALRISGRIYRHCGQHAIAGLGAIVLGIALPIGIVIMNRRKRKSEQAPDRT
jgi:hypothetical protein